MQWLITPETQAIFKEYSWLFYFMAAMGVLSFVLAAAISLLRKKQADEVEQAPESDPVDGTAGEVYGEGVE